MSVGFPVHGFPGPLPRRRWTGEGFQDVDDDEDDDGPRREVGEVESGAERLGGSAERRNERAYSRDLDGLARRRAGKGGTR